jgi:putative addiction module killer protein
MAEIVTSNLFDEWLAGLRDRAGRARILVRIERLALGNPGDVRPIGAGLSEMRIDFGPGYRVYFMRRGSALIVILAGGDKATQASDISTAKAIAAEWKEE